MLRPKLNFCRTEAEAEASADSEKKLRPKPKHRSSTTKCEIILSNKANKEKIAKSNESRIVPSRLKTQPNCKIFVYLKSESKEDLATM